MKPSPKLLWWECAAFIALFLAMVLSMFLEGMWRWSSLLVLLVLSYFLNRIVFARLRAHR